MKRAYESLLEAIDGRPSARGGQYHLNMLSTTCHVYFGTKVGASPDGRFAGFPISDGTSPAHGADRHGPTAVCKSLGKMDQVRKLPNVRKVSMSPWADQEIGAGEISGDYVFSRKPNPALLATRSFDADVIREDLTTTRDICAEHGCPLELIQKDISTVCYEPQRLIEWAKIAMEVVQG